MKTESFFSKAKKRPLAHWLAGMAISLSGLAQAEPWQISFQDDGITVATRPVEGSAVRAFRADMVVNAPVDSILAVMADPGACARWIHGCVEARVLDSEGFYQRNTYQINDMPWPVVDRDLVLEVKITEFDNGAFELAMFNRPNSVPTTDKVRIPVSSGHYLFTPLGDGQTRIEWEQHTDPGGQLPAWLVNQLIVDVPVKTLQQLRTLLNAPDTDYLTQRLTRTPDGTITGWHDIHQSNASVHSPSRW